jgi:2,4-diaminopentanoate dehydrogenase
MSALKKIRTAIYGVGPIGTNIVKFIADREEIEIVAAVDTAPDKAGKDLADITGIEKNKGVIVEGDAEKALAGKDINVAVLATTSSLLRIKPQLTGIISYGINIVSTCEELSYPWITAPEIAREIDSTARKKGVTVLSTGVNPGFLMDYLPLIMTGVCRNVEQITVERIQNAANRRVPFQQKVGIGLTVEEFQSRVKEGTIRHVGLTESIHMISAHMGWEIDRTEDKIEPVIAEGNIAVNERTIEKGRVLGVQQTGRGYSKEMELITLLFKAAAGVDAPYDRIHIKGIPEIDSKIRGGVNGDVATCAIVTNAIPVVMKVEPGLKTMADIKPITFFGGTIF